MTQAYWEKKEVRLLPIWVEPYDLPISTSDTLPLSYRRLMAGKAAWLRPARIGMLICDTYAQWWCKWRWWIWGGVFEKKEGKVNGLSTQKEDKLEKSLALASLIKLLDLNWHAPGQWRPAKYPVYHKRLADQTHWTHNVWTIQGVHSGDVLEQWHGTRPIRSRGGLVH